MQAELHPGCVPDACVAEVPGRPTRPRAGLRLSKFDEEALAYSFWLCY